MTKWDMDNPKLGFKSPEPGEHFKNTSFFEKKKNHEKKLNFFLILLLFSLLFL